MTGSLLFSYGGSTYVPFGDGLHWTVVTAGSATGVTELIPLPPTVTSMKVLEAERAFDGTVLVLFQDQNSAPFGTFWDGSFSSPVPLPAGTASLHADGAGHLYAIDADNDLWDTRSGGAFASRGVIPFQGNTGTVQGWGWTVVPSGDVTVLYSTTFDTGQAAALQAQTFGSDLAWSTPVIVHSSFNWNDFFQGIYVSPGTDGSIHAGYTDFIEVSGGGMNSESLYSRMPAGGSWSGASTVNMSGTSLGASVYGSIEAIVANTYDDAEALVGLSAPPSYGADYDYFTFWASLLCTPTVSDEWQGTQVNMVASFDPPGGALGMAVNAAGQPSFLIADETGQVEVVTTSE